ncbi:uncharacterized protein LOC105390359 isoform X2 [Plutella xylostella]|nr:uncharacterized protein LOC105390359 isoform X2 [Plutella xylostella]
MKVNKKHLAIKGHYFLFNAGIAPLVPFLSTYARHLGLSAATVGAMFMILPIMSLISKPLFGYIADRYKLQKAVFLICQVLLLVCFSAVYLVPVRTAGSVELDCGDGASVLRACPAPGPSAPAAAAAAAAALARDDATALCRMECDMDSPSMWQTVCEHWHIPEYCYSATDSIQFDAHISNVTVEDDHCAYLKTTNVTLDDVPLVARCHAGSGVGYVDVAAPCRLACPAAAAAAATLTCRDNWTAFRQCGDASDAAGTANTTCQASCTLDPGAPWRLMELCEGWRGDAAAACRPRTPLRRPFPRRLPFTAAAPLNLTMAEHDCVYLRVHHIRMDDGSVHFPTCAAPAGGSLFRARCQILCDHPLANELFAWSAGGAGAGAWPLGAAAALGWLAMGGVVAVADAVCNTHLVEAGGAPAGRAWGATGAALLAAAAGALGDTGSGGGYTASLALLLLFLTAAVLCSLPIRVKPARISVDTTPHSGPLLTLPSIVYWSWALAAGASHGLAWCFLFWRVQDMGGWEGRGGATLGLLSAVQTLAGGVPFVMLSGYILKRYDRSWLLSLILVAGGLRLAAAALLADARWLLPLELLLAPAAGALHWRGRGAVVLGDDSLQGTIATALEAIGSSLGMLVGGALYARAGAGAVLGGGGAAAGALGVLLAAAGPLLARGRPGAPHQGYASVIKYEQTDTLHIVDNIDALDTLDTLDNSEPGAHTISHS